MCMGFVQNYTGLMVVRAFLGVADGGLLPGIVFYLSVLYKRSEVGFVSITCFDQVW
jgi:MFS family permease